MTQADDPISTTVAAIVPEGAASPEASPAGPPPALASGIYRVGTLQYTKLGLVGLFFWLLWGDFCLTIMEAIIPSILPLKLADLKAPSTLIGLLITTIPNVLAVMVSPVVSFRSDRLRSRLGRRIPFLLFATPFLSLFLILLGYSEPIGHWLGRVTAARFGSNPLTMTLIIISVFLVGFQFFNMFVQSIYYYLFNDVVPDAVMARFMALFRVVGTGATALYNLLIFPHAETHMREIFVGAGIVYFVGFTAMCLMVREGKYPPPPPNVGRRGGLRAAVKTYWVECFSHRFYWNFFLANAMWLLVGCCGEFSILLSLSLGLTLEQLGQIGGWSSLISMVLVYPAGMLADRLHPLRVTLAVATLLIPLNAIGMIYLFYDLSPHAVLMIVVAQMLLTLPVSAMWNVAELPMYMKLLPKERYGQFASADAVVRSMAMIIGGVGAGIFLDVMRRIHGGSDFAYRYIPVWQVTFLGLSLFFFVRVYRGWKARGGMRGYVPPGV